MSGERSQAMRASATCALPTVLLAVTSSASKIGTPELIMVPRVRVKRATANFLTIGPNIGVLSTNLSKIMRPFLLE